LKEAHLPRHGVAANDSLLGNAGRRRALAASLATVVQNREQMPNRSVTVRVSQKFLIPGAIAASLLLSACGGSSNNASSSPAAPSKPASGQSAGGSSTALVRTASNSTLGATVLVNSKGLTLYRLSGEHAGKFICVSSGCLQVWHPLTVPSGSKPAGSVGSLGVVKRPDGSRQLIYKGMPLYTFAQDTAPGQAHGQGIKDVGTWAAVTTGAAKASSSQAASSPPAAPASGGGYAY
jgi:predicted lipoprotein with Yx(FWY)xxD motif